MSFWQACPECTRVELKVGDRIRDNDPRMSWYFTFGDKRSPTLHRTLTIKALIADSVIAQDVAGRSFRIQQHRIHAAGKPRRSGFDLVREG